MNLPAISVLEVRHEYLQEVEYFDNGLIRELWQWYALEARVRAHNIPNDQRVEVARRWVGRSGWANTSR